MALNLIILFLIFAVVLPENLVAEEVDWLKRKEYEQYIDESPVESEGVGPRWSEFISNLSAMGDTRILNTINKKRLWGRKKEAELLILELAKRHNWDEKTKRAILEGKVQTGMNELQVLASWGGPSEIKRTGKKQTDGEQWVYGSKNSPKYLFFKDGILTAIHPDYS